MSHNIGDKINDARSEMLKNATRHFILGAPS